MNTTTVTPEHISSHSGGGGCVAVSLVETTPPVDLALELYAAQLRTATSFNSAI